jgi:hypothetical protein
MADLINNQINPAAGQLVVRILGAGGAITSSPAFDQIPPYNESGDLQGNDARMTIITDWSSVSTLAPFILGDVEGVRDDKIRRQLPLQHPTKSWLWASSYRLTEGRGAYKLATTGFFDNQPATGPVLHADGVEIDQTVDGKAVYEVNFTPRQFEVLTDGQIEAEHERYTTFEETYQQESMALVGSAFKWKPDEVTIPEGIAVQRQITEIHATWNWVPDTVYQAMKLNVWGNVIGRINRADFLGYGTKFLLAMPPRVTPIIYSPTGKKLRNIEYVFLLRADAEWSHYYRIGSGEFQEVVSTVVGKPGPYNTGDFSALFRAI